MGENNGRLFRTKENIRKTQPRLQFTCLLYKKSVSQNRAMGFQHGKIGNARSERIVFELILAVLEKSVYRAGYLWIFETFMFR